MAIFGIPDPSPKVTWRFLLGCVILAAVLFGLRPFLGPIAGSIVLWTFAGLVGLLIIAFVFVALFRARHPCNRIAKLLQAGKIQDACVLGATLLQKSPEDDLIRLNCVAAQFAAGNTGEARRLYEAIRPERVPEALREGYRSWRDQLDSSS